MTLANSGLIKPPKFILWDDKLLDNELIDDYVIGNEEKEGLISMLETSKLVIVLNKDNNKPIGIFTWKDISKVFSSRPWHDVLTEWSRVVSVSPDDTIDSCLRKMRETGHRAFPVVKNDSPVGIVTSQNIRNRLVHNVNITF